MSHKNTQYIDFASDSLKVQLEKFKEIKNISSHIKTSATELIKLPHLDSVIIRIEDALDNLAYYYSKNGVIKPAVSLKDAKDKMYAKYGIKTKVDAAKVLRRMADNYITAIEAPISIINFHINRPDFQKKYNKRYQTEMELAQKFFEITKNFILAIRILIDDVKDGRTISKSVKMSVKRSSKSSRTSRKKSVKG